jgi:hypothetical protein
MLSYGKNFDVDQKLKSFLVNHGFENLFYKFRDYDYDYHDLIDEVNQKRQEGQMNELNGGRGHHAKRMKDFLAIGERLGIWRAWKQSRQGAVFNFFFKKKVFFFSCLVFCVF